MGHCIAMGEEWRFWGLTPASSYILERHRVWQCAADVAPAVSLPVPYLQDPMLGDICNR